MKSEDVSGVLADTSFVNVWKGMTPIIHPLVELGHICFILQFSLFFANENNKKYK